MSNVRHLHVHLPVPRRVRDRAFEVTFRKGGETRKKRVEAPSEIQARVEAVRMFGSDVPDPMLWSVAGAREV